MLAMIAISLVIFSLIVAYLISTQRPQLACTALATAMLPIGLYMIDGVARMAPQFSLADAARFLNSTLGENDEVIYEGSLDVGSSLVFYLDRRFYIANEPPDTEMHITPRDADVSLNEEDVLRKWGDRDAVYLIINQQRAGYWQNLLIERFHIYHQVMTSGDYVVLSNQS
jgi:hypothetical protein